MERGLNEDRKDLTKWVNEEEWISVCSWLYESNIEDKMKGVSRVAAWRARGEVPFPIESTVDIVECLINEEIQKQSNETQQSLCLMFSMTITRYSVSLGTRPFATRKGLATSVHQNTIYPSPTHSVWE